MIVIDGPLGFVFSGPSLRNCMRSQPVPFVVEGPVEATLQG
jgi:hypothetical protein